jgi:hypothetical protein
MASAADANCVHPRSPHGVPPASAPAKEPFADGSGAGATEVGELRLHPRAAASAHEANAPLTTSRYADAATR